MLSLIPKPSLKPNDIKWLRSYADVSVAQLRQASIAGTSIRDFRIFGGDWDSERLVIAALYRAFADDSSVPFVLSEEGEVFQTAQEVRAWLEELRILELQSQRSSDLEMGYIATAEEFQPHDSEWF